MVAAVTGARSVRIVTVALLLLALGWWFAPRTAPPVYDGVGFPDEPYRFVVHTAGEKTTKAPTTAHSTVPVTKGLAAAATANSAEQAPQVSLLIPTGRLHAPPGTKQIPLQAKPIRPIAAPDGGYLWSNVYSVGSTDSRVTMRDGNPSATITLRAASQQRPAPSIERYVDGHWTPLQTVANGQDIYQATLPGFGDYAVVGTSPLQLDAQSSSTSRTGIIVFVAAIIVVVALVVIAVRRRRTGNPAEADT